MQLLRFPGLQHIAGLQHAITTRSGGISQGGYAGLNLGYHVGDEAEAVTRNRRALANAAGYDATGAVAAQQVHGARSHVVTAENAGCGALDWQSAIPGTDALIVCDSQIPVMILVADCAPLLLVDARQHVLAVIHAGWRGAVEGVASKTVDRMHQEFGCDVEQMRVGIGPCLCAECFEIGEEVAESAQVLAPDSVLSRAPKPHLDLRLLLQRDLGNAGIAEGNIETMGQCPRCENATFFSHRGQGGTAGRFGVVAWWE